jgi:hypothetical protein
MTQKVKPIGTGKIGYFELFYDSDTHTLFEQYASKTYRCGEKYRHFNKMISEKLSSPEESAIKPNTLFDSKSEPDLTNPF